MNPKYTDMVPLPHPVSETHPPMSRENRAAQFAPFAALAGHDAALAETARLTERYIEPDEQARDLLDYRLKMLLYHLDEQPTVTVTWFEADKQKDGGAYRTVTGAVSAVTDTAVTVSGTVILLGNIVGLIPEEYEV